MSQERRDNEERAYLVALARKADQFSTKYPLVGVCRVTQPLDRSVLSAWLDAHQVGCHPGTIGELQTIWAFKCYPQILFSVALYEPSGLASRRVRGTYPIGPDRVAPLGVAIPQGVAALEAAMQEEQASLEQLPFVLWDA